MGRPLSQSVPSDIALVCLIALGLSFAAVQLMLTTPYSSGLLPAGAIDTRHSAAELAGLLAACVGSMTACVSLLRRNRRLGRARLLGMSCCAGLAAFPVLLIISVMYLQGGIAGRGLWLVRVLGVWLAIIALFRLGFSVIGHHFTPALRLLVLGDAVRVAALRARLASRHGRRFEVLLPAGGGYADHAADLLAPGTLSLARLRQLRVWGIVLAADGQHPLSESLLDLKLRGMKVLNDQAFQEQHLGRIDVDALTLEHLLFGSGFVNDTLARGAKRAGDILLSLGLLVAAAPLMLMTAVAIKLDTRGPVFYRQRRTGHLGRDFTLLKFRSMRLDAEVEGAPRWAQQHDPRVTRVGAFIRSTRIDELPQLVNVLRGEMSLVGPRPERPHFVEQLSAAIPFYQERNYVKPGVTGWAQVNFPYGASVEDAREKLTYDLYYVKHRSLLLDFRILLATVRVVLSRQGAR